MAIHSHYAKQHCDKRIKERLSSMPHFAKTKIHNIIFLRAVTFELYNSIRKLCGFSIPQDVSIA